MKYEPLRINTKKQNQSQSLTSSSWACAVACSYQSSFAAGGASALPPDAPLVVAAWRRCRPGSGWNPLSVLRVPCRVASSGEVFRAKREEMQSVHIGLYYFRTNRYAGVKVNHCIVSGDIDDDRVSSCCYDIFIILWFRCPRWYPLLNINTFNLIFLGSLNF